MLRRPVRGGRPRHGTGCPPRRAEAGTRLRLSSHSALTCLGTERGRAPCLPVPQTVTTRVGPLSSALWQKHPQETPRPQQRQEPGTETGHPAAGRVGQSTVGRCAGIGGFQGALRAHGHHKQEQGGSPPPHALGARPRGPPHPRPGKAEGTDPVCSRPGAAGTVRPSAGWPGERRDTVVWEGSKHRAAAPLRQVQTRASTHV